MRVLVMLPALFALALALVVVAACSPGRALDGCCLRGECVLAGGPTDAAPGCRCEVGCDEVDAGSPR